MDLFFPLVGNKTKHKLSQFRGQIPHLKTDCVMATRLDILRLLQMQPTNTSFHPSKMKATMGQSHSAQTTPGFIALKGQTIFQKGNGASKWRDI